MADYGIIPATGAYQSGWPPNFVLTQGREGSISMAGWTDPNEGFIQQTFLGASIRSFDVSAGFGDTTSSLSVSLVNDEFNVSDGYGYGLGDDVYHNGQFDQFAPPVVGAPVFFKFGKNPATIEQAWRKTFDDLYGYNTLNPIVFPTYTTNGSMSGLRPHNYVTKTDADGTRHWVDKSSLWDSGNPDRGYAHFVFGGILQSYTQTRGMNGNPLYQVAVQDPREILSNCEIVLRNYAGTTYNNKNLFNVYGFLEYNPTDTFQAQLASLNPYPNVLTKVVNSGNGDVAYFGNDMYILPPAYTVPTGNVFGVPMQFPITGRGFSRSSENGIPWYRVQQAMTALFAYNGPLPYEYQLKSFGGPIDFRGYKYVVDFGGIPTSLIPPMYYLNFDKLDMLSLAQELCDTISHDMFVSLLPVIDHSGCKWLYDRNQLLINSGDYSNIITGIIRIDAIDKTQQPQYGAIKNYINGLSSSGIYVENSDIGFEVSNVTTDRFIVGAQETEMYYFHSGRDRDNLELRKAKAGKANFYEFLQSEQWSLQTSLKQQILPFYGFLGKEAVTIPRGFGAYQQIMLDSSHVDAYGVGDYYIATEMELRAASVSYEVWKDFLLQYNDQYMAEVSDEQLISAGIGFKVPQGANPDGMATPDTYTAEYAVTVPRCVFNSEQPYMGDDGYPASPCSPPYGYPLYYKRATKIGIPEAGLTELSTAQTRIFTDLDKTIKSEYVNQQGYDKGLEQLVDLKKQLLNFKGSPQALQVLQNAYTELQQKLNTAQANLTQLGTIKTYIQDTIKINQPLGRAIHRLSNLSLKNAQKVHEFVKSVADKHLGRTFLVKIPTRCNVEYNKLLTVASGYEIKSGPFGFKPQPISTTLGYGASSGFFLSDDMRPLVDAANQYHMNSPFEFYLEKDTLNLVSGQFVPQQPYPRYTYGALKGNYNPITESVEFNYAPEPQGGFFNFALFNTNLSFAEAATLSSNQLPISTQYQLAPKNLTNFVDANGRIKAYARFNNSQYLDFAGLSKDSFSSELVVGGGFQTVPDIMEEVNNTSLNQRTALDAITDLVNNGDQRPKSVTFVKCELDGKLYMPPRVYVQSDVQVFGRKVDVLLHRPDLSVVQIDQPNTVTYNGRYYIGQSKTVVQIVPAAVSGGYDGKKVNNTDFVRTINPFSQTLSVATEQTDLDVDNVYALITLPGRITPTVDARYMDAKNLAYNATSVKHALTTDVVKGVAGLDKPAYVAFYDSPLHKPLPDPQATIGQPQTQPLQNKALTDAASFAKTALSQFSLALPEVKLTYTSPSPVYPDVVALPLMSTERCYGPWLSASIIDNPLESSIASVPRYSNIGGKVEFIKDESLAPWNYAGYQLMNEAGSLKAQFSNSLLLFMERGGFTMTEAPTGIALARELQNLGPLVTSINVNVDSSVKTTVKMDLYTSRFGKLQKTKEIAIGQAVRQRQKIVDQTNNMIRAGVRDVATRRINFSDIYDMYNPINYYHSQSDSLSAIERKSTVSDRIVATLYPQQTTLTDVDSQKDIVLNDQTIHMSAMSQSMYDHALQNFADAKTFEIGQKNSVMATFDDIAQPFVDDYHHGCDAASFPHREYVINSDALDDLESM